MLIKEWKIIEEWPNYAVSNYGDVKRLTTKCSGVAGTILSQFLISGYPSVNLSNGKRHCINVHRLVAKAFLENKNNLPEVNHIDATRNNNKVTNLEWVTSSGNRLHAYAFGKLNAQGANNGYSKLTNDGVELIRSRKYSKKYLADKLQVSIATISDVLAKRTWKHLL